MVQIVTAIFGNGIMGSKLESIISSSLWKANTMEHKENMYFWKKKEKEKKKHALRETTDIIFVLQYHRNASLK